MACSIVFFGSHPVATPMLDHILTLKGVNLTHVISQPDRASGRGKILKPTKISQWALEHNIPLLRPNKPDEQLANSISSCDVILVMAYGHILRNNILSLPKLGSYNFHASILPKYRGASPVETAIACGENETGISLMEIVPKMDAGDIIDIEKVAINANDYSSHVYNKLSQACVTIIDRQINNLISGCAKKHQQKHSLATYTRKINKSDGQIDFNLCAKDIFNRVRGFHEHVGTFTKLNGTTLKIGHCEINDIDLQSHRPGEIMAINKTSLIVSTKCGTLTIFELQRQGGKMLNIQEFINGFHLKVGDCFEISQAQEIISSQPFPIKSKQL